MVGLGPAKRGIMSCRISVIIPNRNEGGTIGLCLEAVFASAHDSFEVIVVDDCSSDSSVEIIRQYPCRLVELKYSVGAAGARNIGAGESKGEILFFTDADCLVGRDTLLLAEKGLRDQGLGTIVGGTYTRVPADSGFYSLFQSVFIHYCETKKMASPDYIATHAMAMAAETFHDSGGFAVDFLPILEDVEFSHRMQRNGCRLAMQPGLEVRHFFNYSAFASLQNGFIKSRHWTMYSLVNRDLLADSGTASIELKVNVIFLFAILFLALSYFVCSGIMPIVIIGVAFSLNLLVNRRLFLLFHATGGGLFTVAAIGYYLLVYPLAVGAGALTAILAAVFRAKVFFSLRRRHGAMNTSGEIYGEHAKPESIGNSSS